MASVFNVNVGILGHIDSGKTSLARALSTVASTASFDKNPQSQERGITLDLGFSSFAVDVPRDLLLQMEANEEWAAKRGVADKLQFTLVDCPGHASLIRAVIGGAQIIDIMILVIDVNKGIQTQTAECIIIGEMIAGDLIIALNKVDSLPPERREETVQRMTTRLHRTFENSRFRGVPIVPVSALEALRAREDPEGPQGDFGLGLLMETLQGFASIDKRKIDVSADPFVFADTTPPHAGTVLSGSARVGDVVDVRGLPPANHKIKSMQVFRQPVTEARQGDRVGMCIQNLDAKAFERGLIGSAGAVQEYRNAVCSVSPVSYFKMNAPSRSKFHVTVAHTTVMATATFFSRPLYGNASAAEVSALQEMDGASSSSAEPGAEKESAGLAPFSFEDCYLADTDLRMHPASDKPEAGNKAAELREAQQFALLEFEQPIDIPHGALLIASRLDADIHTPQCRIAFHGHIQTPPIPGDALGSVRLYKPKFRRGTVDRIMDARTVIGKSMFKRGTDIMHFKGLQVSCRGHVGFIDGPFGQKSGKFRVSFRGGEVEEDWRGAPIDLHFKKFVYTVSDRDRKRGVQQ